MLVQRDNVTLLFRSRQIDCKLRVKFQIFMVKLIASLRNKHKAQHRYLNSSRRSTFDADERRSINRGALVPKGELI